MKKSSTQFESHEPFSLIGGPLHQLGLRLGLVSGTNTVRLGLALGVGLWLVVVLLALAQGVTDRLFSMSLVGGHARLLLVIPLFFVCEAWVGPHMTAFVAAIARTGVVPLRAKVALDAEVARTGRWTNWWGPEAGCLLAAILLGNSISVVQGMRWITAGPRLLTMMAMAAIVPLTPLLLFQYPISELAEKFFSRLVGL